MEIPAQVRDWQVIADDTIANSRCASFHDILACVRPRQSHERTGAGLGAFSILVLIGDAGFRDRVCGEIVSGVRCQVLTASETSAALALIRAEKPTLMLLTPEFADVHGKGIAEVVRELSPGTGVAVIAAPSAAAAGSR